MFWFGLGAVVLMALFVHWFVPPSYVPSLLTLIGRLFKFTVLLGAVTFGLFYFEVALSNGWRMAVGALAAVVLVWVSETIHAIDAERVAGEAQRPSTPVRRANDPRTPEAYRWVDWR